MNMWLIIDGNFLAYRAFYTVGHLTHMDESTGMAYGFLREVNLLKDRFDTDRVFFCFDYGGPGKRRELSDVYKNKQKEYTEEETETHKNFRSQLKRFRTKILPALGYRNVFVQRGYEADDIIGALMDRFDPEHTVIVSADKDLWQLMRENVCCYDPREKKITTAKSFYKEWGIPPEMWPHVLALAGCDTDNVIGVKGVGLKTAAKFFQGKLKLESQTYKRIKSDLKIHNDNLPLVRLPFPGTSTPRLREDELTKEKWDAVMDELGFKTMRYQK